VERDGETEIVTHPGRDQRRAAAAIALGGLVLGGVAFGMCMYERGQWEDARLRLDGATTGEARIDAQDDANHAADVAKYAGTAMFAGSVLAVGVAAYLYFSAPRETHRTIIIGPTVTPTSGGLGLSGAF